ncbi:MAG TPA: helix-turn-helix transcriptional regulator [Thermomicrobiaceae bacterium]|nr:helix-turn-helix transcriptional regulator [Thermomicrobiaceae bacterium]
MSHGGARQGAAGELLRAYRLTAGLTQEQLADRAGLSVRGLSNLEGGRSLPRLATLNRLASALDLTPEQQAPLLATLVANSPRTRAMPPLFAMLVDSEPAPAGTERFDPDSLPHPDGGGPATQREFDQSDALLAARYLELLGDEANLRASASRGEAQAAYEEAIGRLQRAGYVQEAARVRLKADRLRGVVASPIASAPGDAT